MKAIQLRYFKVVLNIDDVIDKIGKYYKPLNPIFNGLTRFCRDNGYGSNFSMDEKNGFIIHDLDATFRVHDITIGSKRYATTLNESYIKWSIEKGDTVVITMLESIPSIS